MVQGIGRIGAYANLQKLQVKLNERLRGDQGTTAGKLCQGQVSTRSGSSSSQNRLKLKKIKQKLNTGKRLSVDELNFLRKNAPTVYEKASRIVQARELYEDRLKSCKTKEEAKRVKAMAICAAGGGAAGSSGGELSSGMDMATGGADSGLSAAAGTSGGETAAIAETGNGADAPAEAKTGSEMTVSPAETAQALAVADIGKNSDFDLDMPEEIQRQRAMDDEWQRYARTRRYNRLREHELELVKKACNGKRVSLLV